MKLLFMEDEILIREGIVAEINWEKLNITDVYTAKNGEEGFAMAASVHPDIVMTDIRMPRLDGISAVKKLRRILPQCSIIFISAYTDKEYLKEAIRLKAISFVEKPIDSAELTSVLTEAVREQMRHLEDKVRDQNALRFSRHDLVERISHGRFADRKDCLSALANAGISAEDAAFFASVIILYRKGSSVRDENQWNLFCSDSDETSEHAPFPVLTYRRQFDQIICHFFLKKSSDYQKALRWLDEQLNGIERYYLLAGTLQNSVMRLPQSYYDASLLANRAYFLPYGSIVHPDSKTYCPTIDLDARKSDLMSLLAQKRIDDLQKQLHICAQEISENTDILYSYVKDFYYFLFGELQRYAETNAVSINKDRIAFPANGNLPELCTFVDARVQELRSAANQVENSVILRINRYIERNYSNPGLSIGDISEAMNISVSRLCVIYKKETGITLNQYITDIRMRAAQSLLDDPRNNVRMVAESTGFAEAGYFTRAFKKYTGMTPSEYRGETK